MAQNNGSMTAVARNNGFMTMTKVLDLLDDANFKKEVTSKPRSDPKEVDVECYLSLVETFLNEADDVANATLAKGNQGQSNSLTSPSIDWSPIIKKLHDKFMAPHTNNEEQAMRLLVDELSSFSLDAKAVLTLLAFTVYCTKSFCCTKGGEEAKLVRRADMLLGKDPTAMTKAFVNLSKLIRETLEFTKCIVEFRSYCKDFGGISECIPLISAKSYYIMVFVLGCSVLFSGMISAGNELREPDTLILERVKREHQSFKEEGEKLLSQNIEKIFNRCTDIVTLMEALFSSTVYQCSEGRTVKVDELKKKKVMLLISDLNLWSEDLMTLNSIYNRDDFKNNNYEIMWVPIVEAHDEVMQKQFLDMRSWMQWYTCTSKVSKPAAQFIREKWQFRQQTMVVVLDEEGKVMKKDAITMIRLRGWDTNMFTSSYEQQIWGTLDLFEIVDKTIYPSIKHHIELGDLLLLYGSAENSKTVHEIEGYLEKIKRYPVSCKDFRIKVNREQFLTHLENCISSRRQATSDNDFLTQELLKLCTSYKEQGGFAIIVKGQRVVVYARLTDFVTVLSQHQTWIKRVNSTQPFEAIFQEHYDQVDHMAKRMRCSYKCWHCANTSQ